ncbi:MAG: hypothetical protein E6940_11825 [Clostridium septicum]|uniref:hypothetical protein n=2 Tax=Clostridium septicum TaxID=1504 RepID=UPI00082D0F5E|nr:hypothetical protein [uncultured Clostridium sp.]MDU1314734.1 hypothetical protein [Clostridium septicum]
MLETDGGDTMFKYYEKTSKFNTRGFSETWLRLFIFIILLVNLFNIFILGPILEIPLSNIDFFYLSIILSGILSGCAASYLKIEIETLKVSNTEEFIKVINFVLPQMAYYPESKIDNFITFKPSFEVGLFSSRVTIHIDNNSATIMGPKNIVKRLKNITV